MKVHGYSLCFSLFICRHVTVCRQKTILIITEVLFYAARDADALDSKQEIEVSCKQ